MTLRDVSDRTAEALAGIEAMHDVADDAPEAAHGCTDGECQCAADAMKRTRGMTIEQLTAGLEYKDRERVNENVATYKHIRFSTWQSGVYWFAAVDGDDGCGVAEDRRSAVALARCRIDEMEAQPPR